MHLHFAINAQPGDPMRRAFQMCKTGEAVTFGQLETRANRMAQVLRACGVARGGHVALLMQNEQRGRNRAGVFF